jgi:hypothetical protein
MRIRASSFLPLAYRVHSHPPDKQFVGFRAMCVGAIPPMEGHNNHQRRMFIPVSRASAFPPPSFMWAPQTALFRAIDVHCGLQIMDAQGESPMAEEDEVTYFVNRDSQGWVEQRVRRRVYIELKLECTRNRSRDVQKSRDDWLCVYCAGTFTSKLRLTDHRLGGCSCGPVDSNGSKVELPVYLNLKTAKQGKDLKMALQRGERSFWENLQDDSMWLDLNHELKDITYPPTGARVQVRRFKLPTIAGLVPCQTATGGESHTKPPPQRSPKPPPQRTGKPPPQRSPKRHTAPPAPEEFVDLGDDESDPHVTRPKKRSHARMEEGHGVFHSPLQFKTAAKKTDPLHFRRRPRPAPGPPPQPIRVKPIQTRSPSPSPPAILAPPTPIAHVAPMAPVTPIPPKETSGADQDTASGLRKERQAFYVRAAAEARGSVKMDIPKPPLRAPLQPPGLYYLLPCGLLKFDEKCGDVQTFEEEVHNWKIVPSFLDRLYAAYGRFYTPEHQVCLLRIQFCLICNF